ncbi:MAG TPA: hypothetical protein PKO36_18005 [Candidatus Hydrogenedentes bacterium]|nr:hypothetical protein [Candidatus Hydrogenedentota bacterium]HOV72334.1 hypothetical protein [Candidatus Hydrogenedentota bacterium]
MFEQIERAAEVLSNPKAGWVNRRDASAFLGEVLVRSLVALIRHRNDTDEDVRNAVEKYVAKVCSCVQDVKKGSASVEHSLEELAQACSESPEVTVTMHVQGFVADVKLPNGHEHRVFVSRYAAENGPPMIRVFSICGKPTPKAIPWALRANMQMSHGALALTGEGHEEQFALVDYYLASEVSPIEIAASVREFGFYGDWIQTRLKELDR